MASAIPSTEKDPEYYGLARLDVLRFLEPPFGRVLDVGCGAGGNAKALRERGATEIVGIEIHEPSAEKAREVFDIVLAGAVEDQFDNLTGTFDTILNYDVLEHLADPHSVVKRLRTIAAPNARLHVSLPNARHWSLMRDLVVRGSFGYTKSGHRDSTHLRGSLSRMPRGCSKTRGGMLSVSTIKNCIRSRNLPNALLAASRQSFWCTSGPFLPVRSDRSHSCCPTPVCVSRTLRQ